jgi:hypothetical protein
MILAIGIAYNYLVWLDWLSASYYSNLVVPFSRCFFYLLLPPSLKSPTFCPFSPTFFVIPFLSYKKVLKKRPWKTKPVPVAPATPSVPSAPTTLFSPVLPEFTKPIKRELVEAKELDSLPVISATEPFKGDIPLDKIVTAYLECLIQKGKNVPYMAAWYNGKESKIFDITSV